MLATPPLPLADAVSVYFRSPRLRLQPPAALRRHATLLIEYMLKAPGALLRARRRDVDTLFITPFAAPATPLLQPAAYVTRAHASAAPRHATLKQHIYSAMLLICVDSSADVTANVTTRLSSRLRQLFFDAADKLLPLSSPYGRFHAATPLFTPIRCRRRYVDAGCRHYRYA